MSVGVNLSETNKSVKYLRYFSYVLFIIAIPLYAEPMNHLANEKSPYLLQHKDNPVHWYAWGEQAFKVAKEQKKLIFLSIGYSTCYWCHVMEKECFEDEQVADVLNKYFISIKVDREERPDIDQIYMDAVVALTGRGGWPMSVFLTPDLKPVWGGTYFPKQQFMQILGGIQDAWETEPEKLIQQSSQITQALASEIENTESKSLGSEVLTAAYQIYSKNFDERDGGFGTAPKFPPSQQVRFLLRFYRRSGEKQALNMAMRTLDRMARGGIYDQLGGGFSRYSTDEKWLVPHFEKMLYDNALIIEAYIEASQILKQEGSLEIAKMFESLVKASFEYLLRDMRHKSGAFYSAEDAGEVGKEGEFYVWTYKEIESLLSEDEFKRLKEVYSISEHGNFEHGTNILSFDVEKLWSEKQDPLIAQAQQKLFAARNKRQRPHLDDKILTAWNGMMINSFAKGYQAFGDEKYLNAAQVAAKFILENLYKNGQLLRRYRNGEAVVAGFAEDYAYLIEALISLYESDFDPKWLELAVSLQLKQDELFWDKEKGGYFFSTAKEVVVKKKDIADGATPSANSVSLLNLLRLGALFPTQDFSDKAEQLLNYLSAVIARHPSGFSKALQALDFINDSSKEIVVVVKDLKDLRAITKDLFEKFIPNKVFSLVTEEQSGFPEVTSKKILLNGKTTYYVCEDQTCKLPTNDLETAIKLSMESKHFTPED
ncbi:MAG: thioredoxin domain-containing protein [Bdellovibrionota bacterium]